MDRIFSTRMDDSVVYIIEDLANRLNLSKKAVIERAVRLLSSSVLEGAESNVIAESSGVWKRSESIDETVERSRDAFGRSMKRHEI